MPFGVLGILFRTRLRASRNLLRDLRRESLVKVVVVTVLGVGLWLALFVLFNESFRFLNKNAYFVRDVLSQVILSLFFLMLLLMLVFSNALISFSNLFRSPETAFLFSLPVRHDQIYLYKLFESLVFSSWAFFALGLPLLLAYGLQAEAPWYYYPAMLLYLAPFVVLPAALGALGGLFLTWLVPRHRGKALAVLITGVLCLAVWVTISVLNARGQLRGSWQQALEADVNLILHRLAFTQHPMTPNYWMAKGLLSLAEPSTEGLRAGWIFFGALATTAALALSLGWFVAGALYASAYSTAATAGRGRRFLGSWLDALAEPFRRHAPAIAVLVLKDVKTFFRDPVQWSQVLIFFGLLAVYIGNLRNFSYPLEEPFYQNLISFLNLGATCMTLATMVSRFVFPLVSLEGRRFWILGLVPVERRRILVAKFVFSLGGALLLTEFLVLLSNYILRSSGWLLLVQAVTAAFLCVGLTGLAVGMGTLFPDLKETNPSKIVSGLGGTLTLILSISMVLLVTAAEALVCHFYLVHRHVQEGEGEGLREFRLALLLALLFGALLTSLAAYVPLRLAVRAMDRMEF